MKRYLLVVGVLVVGAAGACGSPCENDVLSEHPSPHGRYKVVVFQRDCGATTGFSTQASLVLTEDPLPSSPGNLFVADTDHGKAPAARWGGPELEVEWEGPKRLLLRYDSRARVFVSERLVQGITVRYAPIGAVRPAAQATEGWGASSESQATRVVTVRVVSRGVVASTWRFLVKPLSRSRAGDPDPVSRSFRVRNPVGGRRVITVYSYTWLGSVDEETAFVSLEWYPTRDRDGLTRVVKDIVDVGYGEADSVEVGNGISLEVAYRPVP